MDKLLRNVIIFAVAVLAIAGVFIVKAISGGNFGAVGVTAADLVGSDNTPPNSSIGGSGEVQDVKLSVSRATYILTPSTLKKDIPVRMEADLTTLRGCSRNVVISAFGVRKSVKEGDNIITFTPTQTGTVNIACSMNMYRGTFTVE